LYTQRKGVLGYDGRTDWADRADGHGFFEARVLEIREKSKKIRPYPSDPPNPFSHRIPKPFSVMYIYFFTTKKIEKLKAVKILFLFCALLTHFKLFAQDGKAQIKLAGNQSLQFSFYDKNHGLWAVIRETAIFQGIGESAKVYKYTPDLSKKEWEVNLKSVSSILFDAKFPKYAYFNAAEGLLGQQSSRFYQLDQSGKMRTLELETEKTAGKKLHLFVSMNHFCELWTKKKSDSELLLIMHHNETLQKSIKTIQVPKVESKEDYSKWIVLQVRDSLLVLVSHQPPIRKLLVLHMGTGAIISSFDNTRKFEAGSEFQQVEYSIYPQEVWRNITHPFNTQATLIHPVMSKNGKYFHDCGIGIKKNNKKRYFVWTTLDSEGQQINQSEHGFELPKSATEMVYHTLTFEETNDEMVKMEVVLIYYTDRKTFLTTRMNVLFDKDGKVVKDCQKSSTHTRTITGKPRMAVNSLSDNLACFIKSSKRISDYITQEKWDLYFRMDSYDGHHILWDPKVKDNVLEIVYFKD
jgi:hypothetical protein